MHRLQLLFLLLGVGLFVFVVQKAGLVEIARGLYAVGWSFAAIFALELVIDLLHSEGWRWCLPDGGARFRGSICCLPARPAWP